MTIDTFQKLRTDLISPQQAGGQLALPQVETTGTILQVYNELAAGKTLRMEFGSLKEAESFRVMIHQYKSKQEEAIRSLQMEMEPTTFSFISTEKSGRPHKITQEELDEEKRGMFNPDRRWYFTLSFKTKIPQRTYHFTDVTNGNS